MKEKKQVEPKKSELIETIGKLKNEIESWKENDQTTRERFSRVLEILEDTDSYMGGRRRYATAGWIRIAFEIGKLQHRNDYENISRQLFDLDDRISKLNTKMEEKCKP